MKDTGLMQSLILTASSIKAAGVGSLGRYKTCSCSTTAMATAYEARLAGMQKGEGEDGYSLGIPSRMVWWQPKRGWDLGHDRGGIYDSSKSPCPPSKFPVPQRCVQYESDWYKDIHVVAEGGLPCRVGRDHRGTGPARVESESGVDKLRRKAHQGPIARQTILWRRVATLGSNTGPRQAMMETEQLGTTRQARGPGCHGRTLAAVQLMIQGGTTSVQSHGAGKATDWKLEVDPKPGPCGRKVDVRGRRQGRAWLFASFAQKRHGSFRWPPKSRRQPLYHGRCSFRYYLDRAAAGGTADVSRLCLIPLAEHGQILVCMAVAGLASCILSWGFLVSSLVIPPRPRTGAVADGIGVAVFDGSIGPLIDMSSVTNDEAMSQVARPVE